MSAPFTSNHELACACAVVVQQSNFDSPSSSEAHPQTSGAPSSASSRIRNGSAQPESQPAPSSMSSRSAQPELESNCKPAASSLRLIHPGDVAVRNWAGVVPNHGVPPITWQELIDTDDCVLGVAYQGPGQVTLFSVLCISNV